MALNEYVMPNDFFQFESGLSGGFDFPCCCCKNKDKDGSDMPCKICGYNECADYSYRCCLCEEIEIGSPQDENYIARKTPASIGPICLTCKNTLASELKGK